LHFLAQEFIAGQLDKSRDELHTIDSKISVFHSAAATFYSPSDPSGNYGMRHERICATPSWRGREARYDCAFVVEDDRNPGMMGMNVTLLRALKARRWRREGVRLLGKSTGAMASLRQQGYSLVLRWTSKPGRCLIRQSKRSCSEAVKEKPVSDRPLTCMTYEGFHKER